MRTDTNDYIEQHQEDAVKAGLEWFWPKDDNEPKEPQEKNDSPNNQS